MVNFSPEMLTIISDTLCGAFEGGSNYWYLIKRRIDPKEWTFESEPKREDGEHWRWDYPLNGGALIIVDFEDHDTEYTLNLDSIERGLQVMQEKYSTHYEDMMDESGDASTSDIFLQCCLFGEVIYG